MVTAIPASDRATDAVPSCRDSRGEVSENECAKTAQHTMYIQLIDTKTERNMHAWLLLTTLCFKKSSHLETLCNFVKS